ncbi:unnamed protein product [Brachionus calyciflorus]|uniref:Uncharacterized protein n=1 Tax=Brachionus calyciflorus TaxID=104777 RepID=A0A814JB86_9BILA|nr:unnamed protein product [Brachionus calyciflorus]
MIYPLTEELKRKILNSVTFLSHLQKIDLNTKSKQILILRGSTASDILEFQEYFASMGITNVIPITNRDGNQLKIYVLSVKNSTTFSLTVQSVWKCGENDHNDDKCKSDLLKCVNCGENHSSWYKGCKVFKEKFRNSVREDNTIDRPIDNSKNFYRTYSAVVNKPDFSKEILAKILVPNLPKPDFKKIELICKQFTTHDLTYGNPAPIKELDVYMKKVWNTIHNE